MKYRNQMKILFFFVALLTILACGKTGSDQEKEIAKPRNQKTLCEFSGGDSIEAIIVQSYDNHIEKIEVSHSAEVEPELSELMVALSELALEDINQVEGVVGKVSLNEDRNVIVLEISIDYRLVTFAEYQGKFANLQLDVLELDQDNLAASSYFEKLVTKGYTCQPMP